MDQNVRQSVASSFGDHYDEKGMPCADLFVLNKLRQWGVTS